MVTQNPKKPQASNKRLRAILGTIGGLLTLYSILSLFIDLPRIPFKNPFDHSTTTGRTSAPTATLTTPSGTVTITVTPSLTTATATTTTPQPTATAVTHPSNPTPRPTTPPQPTATSIPPTATPVPVPPFAFSQTSFVDSTTGDCTPMNFNLTITNQSQQQLIWVLSYFTDRMTTSDLRGPLDPGQSHVTNFDVFASHGAGDFGLFVFEDDTNFNILNKLKITIYC